MQSSSGDKDKTILEVSTSAKRMELGSNPTLSSMFSKAKNSKKQGDVGLAFAIAYYSKEGWTISIPITDSQGYDLIIEDRGHIQRVQVKTTTHKSTYGLYQVALRTNGGNKSSNRSKDFDVEECDILFCLTENGDMYSIPTPYLEVRATLSLGDKVKQFKVNMGVMPG